MALFPVNTTLRKVNKQNVSRLPMKTIVEVNLSNTVYQSTGSKLLDSLSHHNPSRQTTVLFGEDSSCGLGLHHLEIPVLGSSGPATQPINVANTVRKIANRKRAESTAREQAVSRIANILKKDREMIQG